VVGSRKGRKRDRKKKQPEEEEKRERVKGYKDTVIAQ